MAKSKAKEVSQYHYDEKRANNPPVGLVDPDSDHDESKKTYEYDPHLDPELQWTGKAERLSFDVDTVSLHVHERIDPATILKSVQKQEVPVQGNLFDYAFDNLPLREAIEFYKHDKSWSNRLIAGDSLLVMNSLLEKENMAGKFQMVYIDPPYGIKYGSNFQPFVNKKDVKDGKDDDLTQEPEMIKAFRDTWELGIHSYLTYLRDRLLLAYDMLNETGSCFVQISDENAHLVRILMDEIFGKENFINEIFFKKTGSMGGSYIAGIADIILWYGKDKSQTKYNQLYSRRSIESINSGFPFIELDNGECRRLTAKELANLQPTPSGRRFQSSPTMSSGETPEGSKAFEFEGKKYYPSKGRHWSVSIDGLQEVGKIGRLYPIGNTLTYKKYLDESPYTPLTNMWTDTMESTFAVQRNYVVQTAVKVIQRCLLMSTDPGDLVFDPTCGSGTTAYVAEEWGRRWITCDTSRVAITLAKQRLMTASYDYFTVKHLEEGIKSGFNYNVLQKTTLGTLAYNETPYEELLYDQPIVDKKKIRITGPFSVEAVPFATVLSLDEVEEPRDADQSVARSGSSFRINEWKDELLRTGIRGKGGQKIEFADLELLAGTKYLHASGSNKESDDRICVSFGPEFAPLEQRQVELALEEAGKLMPKPKIIVFCAFNFDPEASKDIDEINWPGVVLLKTQMNTDLLTEDLKKKRSSNESFWLMGQPDVDVKKVDGKYQVEVKGFDYYNTKKGEIESGGKSKIAMWMLDTDYDGRSLYPQQVFFPMSGAKDGWTKLSKTLRDNIDEDLIESYRGTESILFESGEYGRIAVKIIDDRGIESLKIVELD